MSATLPSLRADPPCATDLLLAAGILSAPQHSERRSAHRHTWLTYPNVGRASPICPLFVVRSGGLGDVLQLHPRRSAHARLAHALERESKRFGDLLLTPTVAHNESRVRGPVLSLAAWLEYAAARLSHAAFVAKIDDDTHVHAPDLERLLRLGHRELGATNIMVGVLTFYSWITSDFKARAHGWSFGQARAEKRRCESLNCVGPFAFPAGYFFALSSALVAEVVKSGGARLDADRLLQTHAVRRHAGTDGLGGTTGLVLEDVWLGSVLHRWQPTAPINYMTLVNKWSGLYVDAWDFRLKRSEIVNHVRTQARRHLCLHDLLARPGYHCSLPYRLECTAAPCTGDACHGKWCRVATLAPEEAAEGADCCTANASMFPQSRSSCHDAFGSNKWPNDPRYARLPA